MPGRSSPLTTTIHRRDSVFVWVRPSRSSRWPTPTATFAEAVGELKATIVRPARKDEPDSPIHLAPIRQRIESIFWTYKDILTLERHGARTLHNLRARIAQRFLALAACISNHKLGWPSRALVDYVA